MTGSPYARISLRIYSVAIMVAMVAGATTTASATGIPMLIIGLFLLRLTGQGLSSHTGKTTIARHFNGERGISFQTIFLIALLTLLLGSLLGGLVVIYERRER